VFVAVLSDFGYEDPYVGIMKGVMLSEVPELRIIDLGHAVRPQCVSSAAYCLYSAWDYMPSGTTLLSVVDPGVGSERAELLVEVAGRTLVTPDNGTVSLLQRMFGSLRAYRASAMVRAELRDRAFFLSSTFDGRDLFSPLAARMAAHGISSIRGEAAQPVLLPELSEPPALHGGRSADSGAQGPGESRELAGTVMHIDRFGNYVTSIHYSDIRRMEGEVGDSSASSADAERFYDERSSLAFASRDASETAETRTPITRGIRRYFGEVAVGETLAYWGSVGFLELAVRNGNCAARYGFDIGDEVRLTR
jgi:S-adenosylmethionine hydrolase